MDIKLQPGVYVAAVSGGVDSMAMLDLLNAVPGVQLTVAHFDHGIREDSAEDRKLVERRARELNLPFVYAEGKLTAAASEEMARKARYAFLHSVLAATNGRAIITAHHKDDVLETALINMIRGTQWRGLASLRNRETVHRPLLHVDKQALIDHAKTRGIEWREDSTNTNPKYLRNKVRHQLLASWTPEQRQELETLIARVYDLRSEIDAHLVRQLHIQPSHRELHRTYFISLPHAIAKEVMAAWLKKHGVYSYDANMLERLVVGAKTLRTGSVMDISGTEKVHVMKHNLALVSHDR